MQPIFVSSTFRDMQAERDMLNFRVLPEVSEFAKERGEAVRFIDLRWGIDTAELDSDETAQKVLAVCFKEIEDSRPYLIAFLGQRYGTIPPKELVRNAVDARKEDWGELNYLEKSITALEIEYGAFSKNGQPERCLFYYREPLDESLLTQEQRGDYFAESETHAKKLADLKARIDKLAGGRVRSYRCTWDAELGRVTELEELESMVTEDLKWFLAQDMGERKELTWQEREQRDARLFFKEKSEACTARGELFRGYAAEITNDNVRLWILNGESGSGKSIAMSRIASELEDMGREVFAFSCGQSASSSTGLDIVKQAVYHMETLLGKDHFSGKDEMGAVIGDRGDVFKDWKDRWTELIYEYDRKGLKPVVYVIDALDQLIQDETVEQFRWLPDGMPGSMRVAVSCLSSFKLPENLKLRSRVRVRELGPMDEADRELVMQGLEKKAVKELAGEVKKKLIILQQSENPLYLSMMYQRFLMLDSDDFREIDRIGKDRTSIKKYMLRLIDEAPADVGGICKMIMQEAANHINGEQSRYVLLLMAASRNGLRESDIRTIFERQGKKYNALDYSVLMKYMRPYMGSYADGRVDFTHESIREGYRSGMGDEVRDGLNHAIYTHLEELSDDDPVHQAEYVFFAYSCDKKAELVKRIEGYGAENRLMAGSELHDICMVDEGKWLISVLENGKANGAGLLFTSILIEEFFDVFTMSMKQMAVLQQIVLQNSRLYEQIVKELKTKESQRDLGVCYSKAGDIYVQQGKYDEALVMYIRDLKISEQLAREFRTAESLRELGLSYSNIGDINNEQGRLDEALEMYLKSLKISKRLVKELYTPQIRRELAISYNNVGDIREQQGELSKALKMYLKDLEISKQLAKEPGTLENRRELSVAYNKVGDIYKQLGKFDEALDMYTKDLEISEQIAKEIGTPQSSSDLGISYSDIGDIHLKQGRYNEALEYYNKALEINGELTKKLETPEIRRKLGVTYQDIANVYYEEKMYECSLAFYLNSLPIFEKLEADTGHPMIRDKVATLCYYLSIVCTKLGQIEEAKGYYNRALEMAEKNCQLQPEEGTFKKTLSSIRRLALDNEKPIKS